MKRRASGTSVAARSSTRVPSGTSTTPVPSGKSAGRNRVYAGGTTCTCGDARPFRGTSFGGGITRTSCQPESASFART